MTITANSNFTTIQITSTNLSDFGVISSVSLEGKINCEGTYSDTIVEGDVTSNTFTVDTSELFNMTSLDDSIYGFKLITTKTDESVITEYGCLFVDNETSCNVATKIAEDTRSPKNMQLAAYTYLLSKGQNCDCDCVDLCVIYKYLINELRDCTSC